MSIPSLLLLIAAVEVRYVSGQRYNGCDVDIDAPSLNPVIRGTIRLPRGSEVLPLTVFADKILGRILYSFISGSDPMFSGRFTRNELVFTNLTSKTVTFNFTSEFNNTGICVNSSILCTNVFNIAGSGDRAEFQTDRGGYSVLFSSDPDSYLWILLCDDYSGFPRCLAKNLGALLVTYDRPPNNENLERMGNDLRTRTCLTMEEIPGVYTWKFTKIP